MQKSFLKRTALKECTQEDQRLVTSWESLHYKANIVCLQRSCGPENVENIIFKAFSFILERYWQCIHETIELTMRGVYVWNTKYALHCKIFTRVLKSFSLTHHLPINQWNHRMHIIITLRPQFSLQSLVAPSTHVFSIDLISASYTRSQHSFSHDKQWLFI